jgi:hypothetical protein
MLTFILLLLAMIFLTSVFFYKQTNTDFHILQMEQGQIDKLFELAEERQPIVLRGAAVPHAFTRESLSKIPRLGNTPIATTDLTSILNGSTVLLSDGPPAMTPAAAAAFAKEIGLDIWTLQVWAETLKSTSYIGFAGSCRTSAWFGGVGLFKTTAMLTVLLPTEGVFYAGLIPKSSELYLPKEWKYRYPASFTMNDTPLVSELQFIDIKLKAGTALILPPHATVSMTPDSGLSLWVMIEYHEPISLLASGS